MAKVSINSAGIRELLHSPEVAAMLLARADAVADQARADAPVVSGDYRDSIHTETLQHPSRVVARAIADVPYATKVEARHATLAGAIDAARG